MGTDVEGAHADAFGAGPGILLVVGTGSVVRAVGPGGEEGVLGEAVREIAADLGCDVHAGPVVPERGALRNALGLSH